MSAPPFVAEPVGDLRIATEVAAEAAFRLGLPTPSLLRAGMNALFAAGDVVLRVGRTTSPPDRADALFGLLARRGLRVPTVVGWVDADERGLSAIAQQRLVPAGRVDWSEVGRMVRAVQSIPVADAGDVVPVPECSSFPHWQLSAMLDSIAVDEAVALRPDEIDALRAGLARVASWTVDASAVAEVLCHGDVHPGNVLATADGTYLLDWDQLCRGPAAWDHAALLTWERRWGGEAGLYESFAAGFGADLRDDPLAATLAEARLLAATLMRLRAGRTDPAAADEARRRLRYWLGDPAAPTWRAA